MLRLLPRVGSFHGNSSSTSNSTDKPPASPIWSVIRKSRSRASSKESSPPPTPSSSASLQQKKKINDDQLLEEKCEDNPSPIVSPELMMNDNFSFSVSTQTPADIFLSNYVRTSDASTSSRPVSESYDALSFPGLGSHEKVHLSQAGVKLSHLKSLVVPLTYTTRDVVKKVFHEHVGADFSNKSYVEYLQEHDPSLVNDVPTHFVSHTHKELWCDLMAALPIDEENPDRFVWLDAACVPERGIVEQPCSEFRDVLENITTLELVLAPIRNPISIRRTWVHFEVITALRANKQVVVRAPQDQISSLRKQVALAPHSNTLDMFQFLANCKAQAVDKFNCSREVDYAAMIKTVRPHTNMVVSLLADFFAEKVLHSNADTQSPTEKIRLLQARGAVKWLAGRTEDSIKDLAKAVSYLSTNPDRGDLAEAQCLLADVLRDCGQYEQALELYERSRMLHSTRRGKVEAADDLYKSGLCLRALTRFKEAKTVLEECLDTRKDLLGDSHPQVGDTLFALAELAKERSLIQDAIPLYEEALAIRRSDAVVHPIAFTDSLFSLGIAFRDVDPAKALENLSQCYAVRRRVLGEDDSRTIGALSNYGLVLIMAKRLEKARPVMYMVADSFKRTLGLYHADTATAICNLALLLHQMGNHEESCRLYEQAIDIRKRCIAPECLEVAKAMHGLAFVLEDRGLHGQAIGVGSLAFRMAKKFSSSNDKILVEMKMWWGGN